jgi:hypothetical protein
MAASRGIHGVEILDVFEVGAVCIVGDEVRAIAF